MKSRAVRIQTKSEKQTPPRLSITKLAVVSRDYRFTYANGYRDFSHVLPDVLRLADERECDAALFSLFGIVPRASYDPCSTFLALRHIKAVFLEEFIDGTLRERGRYVTYYRTSEGWSEYEFSQVFASLSDMNETTMARYVSEEIPKRVLGNCCVLLCGETNGVKYVRKNRRIEDTYGLSAAIPQEARVILNPIHDRMTRPEMKLKREFLSENGRWVVSVWNKGRENRSGKTRDGCHPAWTVYHDGEDHQPSAVENGLDVEMGIVSFTTTPDAP